MATLHTDELPSPEDILITWFPKFALPNRPLEFEIGLRSDFPFVSEVEVDAAAKHIVANLRIQASFRASHGAAEVMLVSEIVARRNPEGCLSWRATLPCLWDNDAESAAATVTVQLLFLGDAPIRSFSPAVVAVGAQRAIDQDNDYERGHPLVGHKVYAAALAGDVGALRRALCDGDHPEIIFSKAADTCALHACAAEGHVQATAELLNVVLNPQLRDDVSRDSEGLLGRCVCLLLGSLGVLVCGWTRTASLYKVQEGCTPLHYAAGRGHVEVVELFLADSRMNPSVVNNVSTRCCATSSTQVILAFYFLELQAGENVLAYAKKMGQHGVAALLTRDARAL